MAGIFSPLDSHIAKYGVHILELTLNNASANLNEILSIIEKSYAVVREISVTGQEGQNLSC